MMTGRKIKTKINPLIEPLELLNPLLEARQKTKISRPILWRTALQAEVSH